jgi:hypothetical protein
VMACLRNLAISLLRLAGERNMAAGLPSTGWDRPGRSPYSAANLAAAT